MISLNKDGIKATIPRPYWYIELLKRCLLDCIYDPSSLDHLFGNPDRKKETVSLDAVQNGSYWPARAHTMIGYKRLNNIQHCFESVIKDKIEGDLIETGVWRGGACIFMQALNLYFEQDRKIFVADSFEGLPKPEKEYPADKNDTHYRQPFLQVSIEEVRGNFERYRLLRDNVIFIKGFFKDTLHKAPIDKLSILRLDGDMYSSTIQALDALYDKVSLGGYIIVDDYNLPGCRSAVKDFRAKRGILDLIVPIDNMGSYWRKTDAHL